MDVMIIETIKAVSIQTQTAQLNMSNVLRPK